MGYDKPCDPLLREHAHVYLRVYYNIHTHLVNKLQYMY